jgi:inner membrane protein
MEPLAHTLAGACLAEAGFKRTTPLATPTLLIAANLPDVLDGASYLVGPDLAFSFRRGYTHGALAIVLLPALLAWAMLAYDRYRRRRWSPEARPAEAWPLLAASIIGVASHPLLDWLNNYGIRLLMPFDGRWFYGDALFIVDPWLWLLLGGAVMLAWTRRRAGIIFWAVVGVVTSGLVLGVAVVPGWAKLVWLAAVAALLVLRGVLPERYVARTAVVSLVLAAAYIATMVAGSRVAERQVHELALTRGWDVDRVAAMPVPAEPLRRQVIAVTPHAYLFVPVNWVLGVDVTSQPAEVPRGTFDPVVAAALEAPTVRGVRGWLRFPSFEVQHRRDGTYRVVIRDARFAVGNQPGFGVVSIVDLDARLKPLAAPGR